MSFPSLTPGIGALQAGWLYERCLRKFCGLSVLGGLQRAWFSVLQGLPTSLYLQLQVLEGERHSRLKISSYYPFSANQLCLCMWNLLPSESKLSR